MNVKRWRMVARRLQYLARVGAAVWNLPKFRQLRINETMEDCYGRCYWQAGTIEIRLTKLAAPDQMMYIPHIQETLAHELAHLAIPPHGRKHKLLTKAIKVWVQMNWDRNFK